MAKLRDLIKSLITELSKIQPPNVFPDANDRSVLSFGFISAGNGRSLWLSHPMERLIFEISAVLKQNSTDLALSHTDDEWRQQVRSSFGPPLAAIDLADDPDENADNVLTAVREKLKENTVGEPREYAFGCTLFNTDAIPPLVIGPVLFEPRIVWLERKLAESNLSDVTKRRVEQHWSGNKLRKRKAKIDYFSENDVIKAVGNCKYVCSVKTDGLAADAAKIKAQTAARLALTSIAINWDTPSNTLDGFNLLIDRAVRRQWTLISIPGKPILADGALQGRPHGSGITPEKWEDILQESHSDFLIVGELLEFYLSPTGKVERPKLMNTLAQAFLWFHEGCREQVDLMAIVKFTATLDALASGKQSKGILNLIRARLGVKPEDKLSSKGQTARQIITEIYSNGRSLTIHGTQQKFGHDWNSTRCLSEELTRYCLIGCLDWASKNTTDDPLLLMQ